MKLGCQVEECGRMWSLRFENFLHWKLQPAKSFLNRTSIDSLQSRAEVLVKVVYGIYDLSKDKRFNKYFF